MSFRQVITALALPPEAFLEQRVPKKLMLEQGAQIASDKKIIQEGIEDMYWIAALQPSNIGVPEFKDSAREYKEIALLTATIRARTKAGRIIELIHRAIPYPVFLVSGEGHAVSISLAHKRFSQAENGKVVIEEVRSIGSLNPTDPSPVESAFLESLALSSTPKQDMFALYQGWMDRLAALEVARITGTFACPDNPESSLARHGGLEAHARLRQEIAVLRSKAKKEKQLNRRVELNLEIKRLEGELAQVVKLL